MNNTAESSDNRILFTPYTYTDGETETQIGNGIFFEDETHSPVGRITAETLDFLSPAGIKIDSGTENRNMKIYGNILELSSVSYTTVPEILFVPTPGELWAGDAGFASPAGYPLCKWNQTSTTSASNTSFRQRIQCYSYTLGGLSRANVTGWDWAGRYGNMIWENVNGSQGVVFDQQNQRVNITWNVDMYTKNISNIDRIRARTITLSNVSATGAIRECNLASGACTITSSLVNATTPIICTKQNGTAASVGVINRLNNVHFNVTSSNSTDNSKVSCVIYGIQ